MAANGKRRILYVTHTTSLGGAELSLLDVLGALDRTRYEPVAAVPGKGRFSRELAAIDVPCRYVPIYGLRRSVNPYQLAVSTSQLLRGSRDLRRLVYEEEPHIVHTNSAQAQLYAALALRSSGVPVVWHARDLIGLGKIRPLLTNAATRIIAISEAVRAHIAQHVGTPESIVTIYNGINWERIRPQQAAEHLRHSLGIPESAPLVGMVAQYADWKRHETFLRMAARLHEHDPRLHFVIAGAEHDLSGNRRRRRLQEHVRQTGLENCVTITTFLEDIGTLLESLDVLVHPAENEPFGRIIAEAMGMGTAVVAVDACGPGEIITHEEDGFLVQRAHARDLATAAGTLLDQPRYRERLATNATAKARNTFTTDRCARQIVDVYEDILQ